MVVSSESKTNIDYIVITIYDSYNNSSQFPQEYP